MLPVTFHRQHLFWGDNRELRLQRATLQMVPFLTFEFHQAKSQVTFRNSHKWSMTLSSHPGYSKQGGSGGLGDFLAKDTPIAVSELCCTWEQGGGVSIRGLPLDSLGAFWFDCVVTGSWFQPITMHVSLHWTEKNHQWEQTLLGFENYFLSHFIVLHNVEQIIWIFLAWFPQL